MSERDGYKPFQTPERPSTTASREPTTKLLQRDTSSPNPQKPNITASPSAIQELLQRDTSPAAPSGDVVTRNEVRQVQEQVAEGQEVARRAFKHTKGQIQNVKKEVASMRDMVLHHDKLHGESTKSHNDHYDGLRAVREEIAALRKEVNTHSREDKGEFSSLERRVDELSRDMRQALSGVQSDGEETRRAVDVMMKADRALVAFGKSIAVLQKRVASLEQRK